jgi:hypothetical protein
MIGVEQNSENICFGCSRKVKCVRIGSSCHAIGFSVCLECLKDLRQQIDAFRILVITGEDTK